MTGRGNRIRLRQDLSDTQRTAEALLARGLDPDQKAEMCRPLGATGRHTLDDDDWCRLDRVPFGQRPRRPVLASVARGVTSGEGLDDLFEEPGPPIDRVVSGGEVVGVDHRCSARRL